MLFVNCYKLIGAFHETFIPRILSYICKITTSNLKYYQKNELCKHSN